MTSAVVEEFKPVESVEELKVLEGELIQIYNPKFNEYVVGRLKKVEETKRTVKGMEKIDVVIYLKRGFRKTGMIIDMESYEENLKKPRVIIPEVYIPRVKERKIEYKRMSVPSDSA